jgi:hypothetical protein
VRQEWNAPSPHHPSARAQARRIKDESGVQAGRCKTNRSMQTNVKIEIRHLGHLTSLALISQVPPLYLCLRTLSRRRTRACASFQSIMVRLRGSWA